jgi:hypothetical protein
MSIFGPGFQKPAGRKEMPCPLSRPDTADRFEQPLCLWVRREEKEGLFSYILVGCILGATISALSTPLITDILNLGSQLDLSSAF